MRNSSGISIETLVLVAVWKQPFIFQGCFRVSSQSNEKKVINFLFRCEYNDSLAKETIPDEFLPDSYQFTHLYTDESSINLNAEFSGFEDTLYVLKYALHQTLWSMLSNSKHRHVSIDDMAMKALYKKIEPILYHTGQWEKLEEDIGFAASIDFCPQEQTGKRAIEVLFNGLKRP
ncbi:hypothetical protein Lbir_3031 [Legionella birminghamensis]|uniref:Uncharacterized protein n=1 Tax=Legionella birminghamensis TaxID=28083 RepID=A0A378I9Z9_9GAMM|nr:hypothetical protein [Legionella birminghamensis]KTC67783.1 hypothetical protein Lbir_3031 [Legionella birminghamensis]STX32047.1 Uncharacterised protein [Legionella birminghamensis]